jgi:pimeloyl-ACP methyl ester carboxylesterase
MTAGNFVQVNDLSVYYEEAGSGEALVLLHGSMGTSAVWQPYLPLFSSYGRVVVPDLRDHGHTTFTPDFDPAQSADQTAADIIGLLDALGIEQATFCGWSGGGHYALHVAQHHPERVRALVVGGVTLRMSDAARATLHVMGLDGPGQVNVDRGQQAVPHLIALWQQTHTQTADHWLRLLGRVSHLMLNPPPFSKETVKTIATPTLIVWGDRDQFVPVEQAVTLYRWLPNARLAVVSNADHFVTRTHPAQFGRIVVDFLDDLIQQDSK